MNQQNKYGLAGVAAAVLASYAGWRLVSGKRSRLNGKVALITGGSRGLGLAIAREFGLKGAQIAICARDQQELDEAVRKLDDEGIQASSFVADLGDAKATGLLIDDVLSRLGGIDVLVNNTGLIRVGPYESTTDADYEEAMNLMFWAPFHLARGVVPHMKARGSGSVINIASIGGRVSIPHLIPYCCAKFALVGFSTGISAELSKSGIQVLTVTPGLLRTGSFLNARFAGDAQQEYSWFGILGNTPGFSVGVDYAAVQIRKAFETGRRDLTISLPAKILQSFEAMIPNVMREAMALTNRTLPEGAQQESVRGGELDRNVGAGFRGWTTLGRRAAQEFNE